jgi:site-specific recombinase XerD
MVVTARNKRWQDMDKGDTPLDRLARHFEAYNRSEGKSPKTVMWYSRVLRYFGDYLKERNLQDRLEGLDVEVVREFVLYLQTRKKWPDRQCHLAEQNLRAISVQTYVRALRGFFAWLHREGYTRENILANLKPPKAPQRLAEVLTNEEVSRILACLDTGTSWGCRDTAILVTMLDTGLRLSEVANLTMANAHLDEAYLKVMGKGAKERIVPIGGFAQKVLLRYVYHFRPEPMNATEDNLFLTIEGGVMSGNAIQLMTGRLSRMSGVKRLHPHLCRHTFATNYLVNGGDVFTLQQILGHTTLEMVRRYVNLASAHVRVQHRKFSPMDRMKLGRTLTKMPDTNRRGRSLPSYPTP